MSSPSSILVLGMGELGGAVLRNLAKHPQRGATKLAVLKRGHTSSNDPTRKSGDEALRQIGVEILVGDVEHDSEAHLANIFQPFHTVISCNGMMLPPEVQVKVARVALQSGVERYFPWQFGVDYDIIGPNSSQNLFTTQLEVRALLRNQTRLRWVIVSTGMFTSFLFEPAFDIVDAERTKVTAIGSWDNSITVTSPEDIGRLTAELALVCTEVEGVVYTAGDTVSMRRLADVIDRVTGRTVKREAKTVEQLKEELSLDPDNGMRKYRVVFGEGVGVAWDKAKTFNEERGIRTQTVDEWAAANLVP